MVAAAPGSAIEIALPLWDENTSGVSLVVLWGPGTLMVGRGPGAGLAGWNTDALKLGTSKAPRPSVLAREHVVGGVVGQAVDQDFGHVLAEFRSR